MKIIVVYFFGEYLYKKSDDASIYVTSDMLSFCDSVVTINGVGGSFYYIGEDMNNSAWYDDFFVDNSPSSLFSLDNYKDSISSYCNNFCIFGNKESCDNLECPLYKFSHDKK